MIQQPWKFHGCFVIINKNDVYEYKSLFVGLIY